MSYGRLKRSKRYEIIKDIYEQVGDGMFFAREVGLTHASIGKLKNNGDIIEIRHKKQKIITEEHISYYVSLYRISSIALDYIKEDIESGEYVYTPKPKKIDSDTKEKIIYSEIIDMSRRYEIQ